MASRRCRPFFMPPAKNCLPPVASSIPPIVADEGALRLVPTILNAERGRRASLDFLLCAATTWFDKNEARLV